jgi:hypothetical protein
MILICLPLETIQYPKRPLAQLAVETVESNLSLLSMHLETTAGYHSLIAE